MPRQPIEFLTLDELMVRVRERITSQEKPMKFAQRYPTVAVLIQFFSTFIPAMFGLIVGVSAYEPGATQNLIIGFMALCFLGGCFALFWTIGHHHTFLEHQQLKAAIAESNQELIDASRRMDGVQQRFTESHNTSLALLKERDELNLELGRRGLRIEGLEARNTTLQEQNAATEQVNNDLQIHHRTFIQEINRLQREVMDLQSEITELENPRDQD